jgi:hypothetical protein
MPFLEYCVRGEPGSPTLTRQAAGDKLVAVIAFAWRYACEASDTYDGHAKAITATEKNSLLCSYRSQ